MLSTLCTHGNTFVEIQNTMKGRTTTTMMTLSSEVSWTTSTACGWDGVAVYFISAVFLVVINVTRHYTMWLLLFKLCNNYFLNVMQWYSFRCVVNLILGLTRCTGGLKVKFRSSQKWYQSRHWPSRVTLDRIESPSTYFILKAICYK